MPDNKVYRRKEYKNVPISAHKQLKAYAAERGVDMGEAFGEAVAALKGSKSKFAVFEEVDPRGGYDRLSKWFEDKERAESFMTKWGDGVLMILEQKEEA